MPGNYPILISPTVGARDHPYAIFVNLIRNYSNVKGESGRYQVVKPITSRVWVGIASGTPFT